MKYIDTDLLRKEIEKRLKNIRDYMSGTGMRYKGPKYFKAQGKESAYDALLNVLDSLQQEQQEEPDKDLEEAAHNYAWEKQEHHIDFDGDEYLDYGPRYDAFIAGAKWQKEQMMKDAVEGVIMGDIGSQEDEPHDIYVESMPLPLDGKWKMGDKVKLLIN